MEIEVNGLDSRWLAGAARISLASKSPLIWAADAEKNAHRLRWRHCAIDIIMRDTALTDSPAALAHVS